MRTWFNLYYEKIQPINMVDKVKSKRNDLMRLIYKAIDEEYKDIVKLLSETYEAGINPDHNGVVALILAIKRRVKGIMYRLMYRLIYVLK